MYSIQPSKAFMLVKVKTASILISLTFLLVIICQQLLTNCHACCKKLEPDYPSYLPPNCLAIKCLTTNLRLNPNKTNLYQQMTVLKFYLETKSTDPRYKNKGTLYKKLKRQSPLLRCTFQNMEIGECGLPVLPLLRAYQALSPNSSVQVKNHFHASN